VSNEGTGSPTIGLHADRVGQAHEVYEQQTWLQGVADDGIGRWTRCRGEGVDRVRQTDL
jgi:hypothetical protein